MPPLSRRRLQRFFAEQGIAVRTNLVNGLPYFYGSLWSARQRQGHSIHEISYRACFKPQLPALLLPLLTRAGDAVLDPFMGRGTTIIQSVLMQRAALGSDVNPLSTMLTEPRLATPPLTDIAARLEKLPPAAKALPAADRPLLAFFHPQVLGELLALKRYLQRRARRGELDAVDKWIRMVALSRLSGHSSGFFSVRTLPPNQAVSVQTQRTLNARHGLTPPPRDIRAIILKKSKSLLRAGAVRGGADSRLFCADAFRLPQIAAASVAAVITSPPFLDVVDYRRDNWLRCWFAGIDAQRVNIQSHHAIAPWIQFIHRCFGEFARVLQPGGYVAFEVGEARGGAVQLEQAVLQAAAGLPFAPAAVLINEQNFTKTANCWGVSNNRRGTNTNRIVLLRRTA